MIHSSSLIDAPSRSLMVVSAVVTTRMSSPTIRDATDVKASTQRCWDAGERFLPLVRTSPPVR